MEDTKTQAIVNKNSFLSGGGEMGALTRQKDWSATLVGSIDTWPQSLCTAISIMLHSKFPMFIFWGPRQVCFYNDAYRPSLGINGKHPAILGMPGEEAWPDIWHIIKPLIDQVLNGGEATWSEDQLIPIYRNGKMEDVYWTFSYSSINGTLGKPEGIFVTCVETTEKVVSLKEIVTNRQQFRNTVKQAPVGIAILKGQNFMVEMVNDAYMQFIDRDEKVFVGKPLFDSLPEVKEIVAPLLNAVLNTGEPFYANDLGVTLHRHGKDEAAYFNLVYKPYTEVDGTISGIMVVATEVTDSVKAKHSVAESAQQFRNMVMDSPIPMTIFRGYDHVIEMANTVMLEKIWRKKEKDVIGKKVLDVFPELKGQQYPALLKNVLDTGRPYRDIESPVFVEGDDGMAKFYLDFEYAPLFEADGTVSGIMITVNDVTEKVNTREKIKESEEKLRVAIQSASLGTFDINLLNNSIEYSERYLEMYGYAAGEKPTRQQVIDKLHPDDKIVRDRAFETALRTGTLEYEARVVNNGKANTWVRIMGKVIYGNDKRPLRVLGTVMDISKEKNTLRLIAESEVRLRLATEGTKLATWDLDLHTRAIVHSPRLAEIFGHSGDTVLTHPQMRDQLQKDDAKHIVEKAFDVAMKTGIYSYEARVVKPDKTICWIKTAGNVIFDDNGNPLRMIGTMADVTESKANEEKLAKLAAIVQSSEDAIISKTTDSIITSWNAAAERLFGYTEAEMIGASILKLIPEDRLEEEKEIVQKLKKGEKITHFETKRVAKDKTVIDISLTISPIRDTQGNIIGASKIVRDVTAQKQIERLIAENEHRLNIAAEAAELGTWELNFVTDEVAYSKRYLEILEFEGDAAPQHDQILTRIHPDDMLMRNKAIKQAMEDGILDIEMRIIGNISGKLKWIKSRGRVIYDAMHQPLKMVGTTMDITQQKTLFETLRQSEQRQNLALESAGMGSWDLDFKTEKVIRNLRYAQIFGYDDEEQVWSFRSMLAHVHADDMQLIKDKIEYAKEQGSFEIEVRIIRADKVQRWIKAKAKTYYDEANKPIRILGTILDITEEKMNSEELKKSEERFRLLANSMPQLVWTGDAEGNLNYFNQSVYSYAGLSKEQVDKEGWLQIVHPDDREDNIIKWTHSVATGEDFLFEHRFLKYDGEYRWQLSRAIPQRDEKGNIQMWVGTSTDIHEIKENEQQKDLFISMASHELKTPITSIKGYVQILMSIYNDSADAFLKNSLTTVNKQINTLTNLVSELLDLSKIKSGSLQLNKESFELNNMLQDVINNVQHSEPGHIIEFVKEKDCTLYADKERIGQVLINFLTNAIKYSPGHNVVTVTSTIKDGYAVVSVEDKGIGIKKADQEKIFQRFYRVEGTNEKTFPGFGIGLFIASEIVERHHGKIEVKSEQGKGSLFSFLLPLQK